MSSGSSQSGPEAHDDQPVIDPVVDEGELHPYLQFPAGSLAFRRCQKLRRMRIGAHSAIDWGELATLGETDRARMFVGQPDTPWDRLFDLAYTPSYRELVVEFLSSFVFRPEASDDPVGHAPHQITFRMAGVQRQMSLARFAVRVGLYTDMEIVTPLYTDGIWQVDRATLERFWLLIGRGRFVGPKAAATRIIDPLYRYLHMAIARSIAPRGRGTEHVTERDVFFLYCLIWRQPCALARCMAQFFASAHSTRGRGRLFGGAYITIIARRLGLYPDQDALLSPAIEARMLGRRSLNSMRLIGNIGGELVFRTRGGARFLPVPLPEELPPLPDQPVAAGGGPQAMEEDEPALQDAEEPALQDPEDQDAGGAGDGGDQPPLVPQFPHHVYREVRLCPADRAQMDQIVQDQRQIILDQRYIMDCMAWVMPRLAGLAQAAGLDVPPQPVRAIQQGPQADQHDPHPPPPPPPLP